MLQNLRKHAQGWVAILLATLLCLAFALWGIQYYLSNSHGGDAVATVDGYAIHETQANYAYKRIYQSVVGNQPGVVLPKAQQNELKLASLSELILQRILYVAAQKAGLAFSNVQLGQQVAQIPIFEKNGQFSSQAFEQFIANFFPSQSDFFEDLRQKSMINQLRSGIVDSAFALNPEIDQALRLLNQQRDITYVIIPAAPFVKKDTVTPSAIEAYYKAHAQDFQTAEQVSIQYIELSPQTIQQKMAKTAGKSPSGAVVPQEQYLSDAADQLVNLTYTHPDTLKPASDAVGLPIQTSEFFTREGTKVGIAANPKLVTAAFSDSVLKQGNNSDLIQLDNQTAVVLRIANHHLPQVRPLSEVRSEIVQTLALQAAGYSAQQLGEQILSRLRQGQSLTQLAAAHQLPVIQKVGVQRKNQDVPTDILSSAFNISAQSKNAVGNTLPNGDFVVVSVSNIKPGNPALSDPKQREEAAHMIANQSGVLDYYLYVIQQVTKAHMKKEPR